MNRNAHYFFDFNETKSLYRAIITPAADSDRLSKDGGRIYTTLGVRNICAKKAKIELIL